MDETTKELLKLVSNFDGTFHGAYNIRVDGSCAGRQSSEHIKIYTKEDAPGLVIRVDPGTKAEFCQNTIPALQKGIRHHEWSARKYPVPAEP